MLKSVYEKWVELKNSVKDSNDNNISAYYLGKNIKTNLYFSISKKKMSVYLEFTNEVLVNLKVPSLKGMIIDVKTEPYIDSSKEYIHVENESNNESIFTAFTSSLVDELISAKSYYDAYECLMKVIKEYKDYFADPTFSLSRAEEQGLCAELIELEKIIQKKGEDCLLNWQGPAKNKRDFVFNNCSIEVKSTSGQINPLLTIANENQLDFSYPSDLRNLFLSVYILEEVDYGIDVMTCISNVEKLISSAFLRENFRISLLKMKVDSFLYKSRVKFSLQKHNYYKVFDNFPKITKENIGPEISNVSYKIKLDSIDKFRIDEEEVYGQF